MNKKNNNIVEIFTDGACKGNPGPGGYGAILKYGKAIKEISGCHASTTNNRMELLGIIEPLEALKKPCAVHVVTDSQYAANAINQNWLSGWLNNGWKTAAKKPVKNQDLWERLLTIMETHDITIEWVKGHAQHPENEKCDRMAVNARLGKYLVEDEGYNGSK